MEKIAKTMKKLVLQRETLVNLQSSRLHEALGNATRTASNPCCPLTKVGCG